ncbi:MAK10-like protein, partial [Tanacetum coccineum]
SNWLERLPAGSISIWEDLITRFLAQFFPPGRTAKLHNDILMFQQHHGESQSEAWTRFKDLLQKVPHHGDLALYDNESWNYPRDFAKPVKAITLPQDVPSTSDRRLIELGNQVQRLMEAYLAMTQPTQVNKITTPCEIGSGPHDTQYCMENPEQAFVEYASSRTDESGDARLSKFESDFKQQQSEMTNKIDTVLKAITDRIAGTLPSDTVKNPKLRTHPVSSACTFQGGNHFPNKHAATDTETKTPQPKEPKLTLEAKFQDLHLNLLVLKVLAHAPIYNAILDKYVESLELDKNGSAFVQGEILVKIEDPRLFTLPCRLGDSKPFDTLADLASCVRIEFLGAIPINLKCNMWESEDLIKKPINWDKPSKNGDGAWHAKIRLIDPDGEEFTKTLQSIPTTRKLSERESPREIIYLDHFYDT